MAEGTSRGVMTLEGGSVERSSRSRGLLPPAAAAGFSSHTVPVLRALPPELVLSDRVRKREAVFGPSSGLETPS